MSSLNALIKSPKSDIFRRAYIKRRVLGTGLFETDWFEITQYVKSWGKITTQVDNTRLNKFTFGNAKLVLDNSEGTFNPSSSEFSLWSGYLNQQRTLVKIDAGYFLRQQRADGVWVTSEVPSQSLWDEEFWDADPSAIWDGEFGKTIFKGIVSGDILVSDKQDITFNIKPLTSIFQDFNARDLTGWTTTGMTASQFVTMLRDQQIGGAYVFRPFFDDTTSSWDISTTSNVYTTLNTSTSEQVYNSTVWDLVEKLSESELYVPYITRAGVFKFVSRDANSASPAFEFHGVGSPNSTYGNTIKDVRNFGFKISKYYSGVRVKYREQDTTTSYQIVAASLAVSPTSNPWVLGSRELKIENLLIPTSTVAATIAETIYTDVSAEKNEIEFSTSFVPHLDILDRVSLNYDPSPFSSGSLWDQQNWASDSTSTSDDLIWDSNRGNSLILNGEEFKFLSIEVDLDQLENRFTGREV